MRCFVALDVSEATRALASRIRDSVTEADHGWDGEKWVAPENLHVTLAFLGDVSEEEVRLLVASLYANSVEPFTLGAPALVAVPGTGNASMIWLRYLEESTECFA